MTSAGTPVRAVPPAAVPPRAVVVVGAGIAGVQTAVSLREAGYAGPLVLVGAEPHPPYDRPPLSKEVLLGHVEDSRLDVDFDALGVDLRLGRAARALDPARALLTLDDGTELPYAALVLATGAAPVRLPGQPSGVLQLRTHDDALALRAALRPGTRIAVVGAGWIGAEAASAAARLGCTAVVVEAAPTPLAGALPPELAERTRPWYAASGVELRTATGVGGFRETGGLELSDGTVLAADVVLVGVGARPATDWLRGSGVPLDERGAVAADATLRAAPPGPPGVSAPVYAVGDCASFPSARYRQRLTVHHWDHALQSARTVAANVLADLADPAGAGDPAERQVYDPVPYFWSEQFGHMVQYLGRHADTDELVLRGEPVAGSGWGALWLRDGVPVALLAVDRPRDLAQGRRLIERGTPVDRARAADPAVPLKSAAV